MAVPTPISERATGGWCRSRHAQGSASSSLFSDGADATVCDETSRGAQDRKTSCTSAMTNSPTFSRRATSGRNLQTSCTSASGEHPAFWSASWVEGHRNRAHALGVPNLRNLLHLRDPGLTRVLGRVVVEVAAETSAPPRRWLDRCFHH
jgi:hypothetical protein